MRALALPVMVALLAASLIGCGSGNGPRTSDPGDPARADLARARQLLVRLSDLPGGWTGNPHEKSPEDERSEGELRACLGVEREPRRTADLSSDDFSTAQAQVTSRATLAPTADDARREFAATSRPEFPRCLADVTRRRAGPAGASGAGGNDVTVVPLPVPPLADGLSAHRLTVARATAQGPSVQYVDLFVLLAGRAQVSVNFITVQSPPSPELERSVMARVADRARQ